MPEKIVQLNEEVIKGQIKELVRGSVEAVSYTHLDVYKRQDHSTERLAETAETPEVIFRCLCCCGFTQREPANISIHAPRQYIGR